MPGIGDIASGVGVANRPGDGGMGGRRGGGGPRHGGTHTFPSGTYRYGVPSFFYPSTIISTVRTTPMFGLQGKGLIVGLLLGFFALPFLINAVRR